MSIIGKFFKKSNVGETAYLIKVSNQEYVTKILSEQKILNEYVDWDSVQSLNEFSEFKKPYINYALSDFLMQLNIDVLNELKENPMVGLYKVDSFGWYYKKVHRNEIKLFNSTHPNKLNNLQEQNQKIHATSFDRYRAAYRPSMATNILTGAMGLAYHCNKEDYDNFSRKIKWQDDQWILKVTELETIDRQILIQLLLFQNNKNRELIDSITKGSSTLSLYNKILEYALEYFMFNEYSMKNFLQVMTNKIKSPETEPLVNELKQLNDRYVTKGLSFNPKISHSKYIKEFIDLGKTDTGQLKHLLEGKELNKSAIFLLGMLNLGDRLDEQFAFDNFIPSIISLTVEHIIDMNLKQNNIHISFNTSEIEKNRNNKFTYVQQYCHELQLVKNLKDQLKELQEIRENLNVAIKDQVGGKENLIDEKSSKNEPDEIEGKTDIPPRRKSKNIPGESEDLFNN